MFLNVRDKKGKKSLIFYKKELFCKEDIAHLSLTNIYLFCIIKSTEGLNVKRLSYLSLLFLLVLLLTSSFTACNQVRVKRDSFYQSILLTPTNTATVDKEVLNVSVAILSARFESAGYKRREFKITLNDNGSILVECYKTCDIEVIVQTGEFTFKDGSGNVWLTGEDHIKNAYAENNTQDGGYMIVLEFSNRGILRFTDATNTVKDMEDNKLYIYIDDTVIAKPTVNEQIVNNSAIITGAFTYEEAIILASVIKEGKLPITYTVSEISTRPL